MNNADHIHDEWPELKIGDKVKMCPGDWGPPAYEMAVLEINQAVVIGYEENGKWSDLWKFILLPQSDGTTRLIARGRDMKSGGYGMPPVQVNSLSCMGCSDNNHLSNWIVKTPLMAGESFFAEDYDCLKKETENHATKQR